MATYLTIDGYAVGFGQCMNGFGAVRAAGEKDKRTDGKGVAVYINAMVTCKGVASGCTGAGQDVVPVVEAAGWDRGVCIRKLCTEFGYAILQRLTLQFFFNGCLTGLMKC